MGGTGITSPPRGPPPPAIRPDGTDHMGLRAFEPLTSVLALLRTGDYPVRYEELMRLTRLAYNCLIPSYCAQLRVMPSRAKAAGGGPPPNITDFGAGNVKQQQSISAAPYLQAQLAMDATKLALSTGRLQLAGVWAAKAMAAFGVVVGREAAELLFPLHFLEDDTAAPS
ncbi:MAG: hypothetical protein WDW36_003370 [Sanguina aurantia]